MSQRLIEKIKGKSCGGSAKKSGAPKGLLNKGGKWWEDFKKEDKEEQNGQ